MDSANKQTAIIAETTYGTTPATPAFKLVRDVSVSGAPQRPRSRSPERRADRTAAAMVQGLSTYPKAINLVWARDAALDILLESVFCGAWASDVLKNGSTQKGFTLEEKYEGGATDPYRRVAGCMVDTMAINFRNGEAGQVSCSLKGKAETTATTATIASATYAAPTPGYDPSTPADILVNGLFGMTTPKVMAFNMNISNSLRDQHAFGSNEPFGLGMGLFDISGSVTAYFTVLADYSAFVAPQTGLTLDFTIGATTLFKDQLVIHNADVWNPNIDDPGATGDHMVTLNFMGRYHASGVASLTRLVA